MRDVMRRAQWLAGVVWVLSWFELYLEIYRHHHLTPSFHFNPPLSSSGSSVQARPGDWLLAVLSCSALAPPLFALSLIWRRLQRGRSSGLAPARIDARFPMARVAMTSGIMLSVLGTVNQLIRRPPIQVDLTLRTGNGGFIVLGAALAMAGLMFGHHRTIRALKQPE